MSGLNQGGRFVVAEMRRRWTLPEKKAVVAESQTASTAISAVARKNGIAPALLFRWRRELGAALRRPAAAPSTARFVPVCLPAPAPVAAAPAPAVASSGVIEIELVRSGMRLRVDGQVDAAALKRVLDVLEGR
jgi:transposase